MELSKLDSMILSIESGNHEESIELYNNVIPNTGVGDTNITDRYVTLEPKHKVFLSHSGAQKDFVEQLCIDLERWDIYPFFDKRQSSLPIGDEFPKLIFDAVHQCQVGVLVFSEEFFTKTKWPMLELVAMVEEFKKPTPRIKIIPVFYSISWKEWLDEGNRSLWVLQWEEWAIKDKRICVEEWKEALQILKRIKGLVMIEGTSAVKFREAIVEVVRKLVLPESKWDDSHIEGRLRLCQDIKEKIYKQEEQNGVRVMGLYGMGGMGKTTICKAMCNELFDKFKGRVCHIEMKSASEVELLRKALRRLTNTRPELLDGLDIDECGDQLNRCVVNQAVFLALDNVSDNLEVIRQAKTYLGASWGEGSVVIITARSLGELMCLKQYIKESGCVEMPELEEDEAKRLFLKHVALEQDVATKVDKQLANSFVKRCYFSKGEGKGYHYIPLALQVLGEQLGCVGYNSELWDVNLKEIRDTFDCGLSGDMHPIFSILRTSYDSLSYEAKMLFMDVALYLPHKKGSVYKWNFFEWLSMVHGSNLDEIRRQLEGLKRKSLLENLGDGFTNIVIHDLWREFCMAETKVGKFGDRRWVFLEEESSEFGQSSPSGCCWENLKRICFMKEGWRSLHGVQLNDFANVTVLKLEIEFIVVPSALDLDLRGLKHLKSLELRTCLFFSNIVGLGSLKSLVILSWIRQMAFNSPCIEEIGRLTKLQVLVLSGFTNTEMPDMSMLTSLRAATLRNFHKAVNTRGLSSELTNLRSLNLGECRKLRDCPGLGELDALEELNLSGCDVLKEAPCLRLLTRLKVLDITRCKTLRTVSGLSDLVALEKLRASGCSELANLPDIWKLTKLQVLRCSGSRGMSVLDLGVCSSLRVMHLTKCTALKSVTCSGPLCALRSIKLSYCCSLEVMPDLSNFPQLEELSLWGCAALIRLTSIVPLHALKFLDLTRCRNLTALPNHLSSSENIRVLYLQKSGIQLSAEDIRNLEASCEILELPSSSGECDIIDEEFQPLPGVKMKSEVVPSKSTALCRQDMGGGIEELNGMDIIAQNRCRFRRLPDGLSAHKITRLVYTNAGDSLLALTSKGMHKLWDWRGKATVSFAPQLRRPVSGLTMINEIDDTSLEVVHCMSVSKNDNYLVSASGGVVSCFNMIRFKVLSTISEFLPIAATSVALYPQDNNIIAIGMEDSTIRLYNIRVDLILLKLKGHHKRVTCLAFSNSLNVLVSSGGDGQLCIWTTDWWKELYPNADVVIRPSLAPVLDEPDRRSPCKGDIRLQFHKDQQHLLVVGELQLAVYDASTLKCLLQWVPESPFTAAITDATFSCDGQFVYTSFADGSVGVFDGESLLPRCRLARPFYTPQGGSGSTVYPSAIAANPVECNQFALGMSDGGVLVIESLELDRVEMKSEVVPSKSTALCRQDMGGGIEELNGMDIIAQNRCRFRRLPDGLSAHKITRLVYTNAGDSLLALTSKGMHKLWDWRGKATVSFAPQLRRPVSGLTMINEIDDTSLEVVHCMSVSKNDNYLVSASGGVVSCFNMIGFKVLSTISEFLPIAATSVALYPQDNNIIAIGMEDSTIRLYNIRVDLILLKLKGHHKRVTCLAFSNSLNVLVSSGGDGQLCIWTTDWWKELYPNADVVIRPSLAPVLDEPDRRSPCKGDIRLQFHKDQQHLLVVGELQLAVYDASTLKCLLQWVPESPFTAAITDATFSCDGQFVYTSFADGSVGVFDGESLLPRCRLARPFYTPQGGSGSTVYPSAIAANPVECNQFALGMSDGGVLVVEGLKLDGESVWAPEGSGTLSRQSHKMMYCCDPTQV